ncbi:MAG: metal-dependent transcriptional regulator [bacterium]
MTSPPRISKQMEDYLKNIYKLQAETSPVTTKSISDKMGISPASVTSMAKKLGGLNLLAYKRYKGVVLTPTGEKVALEIIRHHRLLELYLTQKVGLEWHKVDAEAEELEHVLSEEVEAAMDKALGYPTLDPHGDPIPSKDGTMVAPNEVALSEFDAGRTSSITRVLQDDSDILIYLGEQGIYPDVSISVEEHAPFGGPVTVSVAGKRIALGRDMAARIFVSKK